MGRTIGKLTALQVQRAKEGKLHDGGGLYLLCHPGGSKSWAFRYGGGGKRYVGLGPTHTISLPVARERARACRQLLLDGVDPISAKRERAVAAKLDAAKALTFAQAAAAYHEAHRAGWRSPKHAAEWGSTLTAYAYPAFGHLPVTAIDVSLILKALEPIWSTKAVTAGRVRARIEAVLDWAKARGYRDGENPRDGAAISTTSCRRRNELLASGITPPCPTLKLARSWPSYARATASRPRRSNS
jgi:hypothetical protein